MLSFVARKETKKKNLQNFDKNKKIDHPTLLARSQSFNFKFKFKLKIEKLI